MARVIAIANQKGGVGKTTTAVSVATGLQILGKKVLLIDTDSQCNSTDTYRINPENTATIYDLLFEGEPAQECITKAELGDIIPSDPLMRDAEQRFPNDSSRPYLLKEKCEPLLSMYDFIIIDTPPAIGAVMSNVLTFCQEAVIPVTTDRYGLQGIDLLSKTIDNVRKYSNSVLKISGILLTQYKGHTKISKGVLNGLPSVAEKLNTQVFDTKIRHSISTPESQSARTSLYEYAGKSNPAIDYLDFCREIMEERLVDNGEK